MKKHDFTIFILIAALILSGAAWFVKSRLLPARAVRAETQALVGACETPRPALSGAELIQPFGPVFDEALGQWTLRESALLRGAPGAFVYAVRPGRVLESRQEGDAWRVTLRHEDGSLSRYGGLRAGVNEGRRLEQGDIIGQLAGERLELGWRDADGLWRDPAAFFGSVS